MEQKPIGCFAFRHSTSRCWFLCYRRVLETARVLNCRPLRPINAFDIWQWGKRTQASQHESSNCVWGNIERFSCYLFINTILFFIFHFFCVCPIVWLPRDFFIFIFVLVLVLVCIHFLGFFCLNCRPSYCSSSSASSLGIFPRFSLPVAHTNDVIHGSVTCLDLCPNARTKSKSFSPSLRSLWSFFRVL